MAKARVSPNAMGVATDADVTAAADLVGTERQAIRKPESAPA
jgi:hypothetical protein